MAVLNVKELLAGDFFFVSDGNSLLFVFKTVFGLFATLCDSVALDLFTSLVFVLFNFLVGTDGDDDDDDDAFFSSAVFSDAFGLLAVSLDLFDCCGFSPFDYINKINYCHFLLIVVNIWFGVVRKLCVDELKCSLQRKHNETIIHKICGSTYDYIYNANVK